jgi:hypothetical protein
MCIYDSVLCYYHILRRKCLLKQVIVGMIKGGDRSDRKTGKKRPLTTGRIGCPETSERDYTAFEM